ncbi:FAD-binding protein [Ensifer sp. NBAIM29]|nr:FAD-binding protein [Ensifer sp. NBAIM29]
MLANGQRFVNEASGHHDYVEAMISAVPEGQEFASWLICDHRFQRRYGSRYSRPAPMPLFPHIRSGYLKTGKTIEDLGLAHGIDPHGLRATMTIAGRHAAAGVTAFETDDPDAVVGW